MFLIFSRWIKKKKQAQYFGKGGQSRRCFPHSVIRFECSGCFGTQCLPTRKVRPRGDHDKVRTRTFENNTGIFPTHVRKPFTTGTDGRLAFHLHPRDSVRTRAKPVSLRIWSCPCTHESQAGCQQKRLTSRHCQASPCPGEASCSLTAVCSALLRLGHIFPAITHHPGAKTG